MKQQLLFLTFSLAIICFSRFVLADSNSTAELFTKKCAKCHGTQAKSGFAPILFGQEPRYLALTLAEFRNKKRKDKLGGGMNRIAKKLTDEQIQSLSTYLAGQDPCSIKVKINHDAEGFKELFIAGRELVVKKNCMHCHSSFHHAAPRMFGQKLSYLKMSLKNFSNGKRTSTSFPVMNRIAEDLSKDEILKISTYLSGMSLMRECSTDSH